VCVKKRGDISASYICSDDISEQLAIHDGRSVPNKPFSTTMAAALTTFATNAIIAFCRRETVLPAASVTRNRMLHAFNDYGKLYRPFLWSGCCSRPFVCVRNDDSNSKGNYIAPLLVDRGHNDKTNQHVPWCPNTDSNKMFSVFCEMSLSTAAALDLSSACSMHVVRQQRKLCHRFIDMSPV